MISTQAADRYLLKAERTLGAERYANLLRHVDARAAGGRVTKKLCHKALIDLWAEEGLPEVPKEQRNILFIPVRGSRLNVILKDKDDPKNTAAASLQGTTIHVHWADGFTHDEVKQVLKPWWPAATDMEFPK